MKVKFANKVFEVLYTIETAGLTMYAVEDEPNHIDWFTNVDVVDDEKERFENEIEIPYGAKDSELQEATYYIPKGFHAEIDDDKVVIKKGENPTAWSEEDENIKEWIMSDINKLLALNRKSFVIADKEIIWIKSLKGRVGCEANCTATKWWSVEDMSKIQRICKYLDDAKKYYADITEVRECIDWLKSIHLEA